MINMVTVSTLPCPISSPCAAPLIRMRSQWCMLMPFHTHCNLSRQRITNQATVANARQPAPPRLASPTVPTSHTWRTMTTRCSTRTISRLLTQPHTKHSKTPHPPVARQRPVIIINSHYQLRFHPIYHGTNFQITYAHIHTHNTPHARFRCYYECLVNYIPVHKVNPVQWITFFYLSKKKIEGKRPQHEFLTHTQTQVHYFGRIFSSQWSLCCIFFLRRRDSFIILFFNSNTLVQKTWTQREPSNPVLNAIFGS